MPTAKSTAKSRAVLPNSAPITTINVDIPTNRAKLFNVLACGCQVISVLLRTHSRTLVYCLLLLIQRLKRRWRFRGALTVPADGVCDQRLQRLPAGEIGQKCQLLACLVGILRQEVLG